MRRALALAVAGLLVLGACNGSRVEVIPQEDLPADIYGATGPQRSTNLVLYLVQGNRLVRVSRVGRAPGEVAEVAIKELLAGPTAEELNRGIETRMPEGLELRSIEVDGGVAQVNLTGDFVVVQDPADPHEYLLRVAQIVWTLDELPDINAVRFLIEGQPRAVLDQDRNTITTPVARKRYQRFEPRRERPVSSADLQIDI